MGTRCADHATPLYPQKLALTSLTGGGRSVGIVRSRTKAMESLMKCLEPSGWQPSSLLHNAPILTLRFHIGMGRLLNPQHRLAKFAARRITSASSEAAYTVFNCICKLAKGCHPSEPVAWPSRQSCVPPSATQFTLFRIQGLINHRIGRKHLHAAESVLKS